MSRCLCCNVILTPYELSVKNSSTFGFMDSCTKCLTYMQDDVNFVGDESLLSEVGIEIADYIDYEGTMNNE